MWNRMSVEVMPKVTSSISRVQGSGTRVTRCRVGTERLYWICTSKRQLGRGLNVWQFVSDLSLVLAEVWQGEGGLWINAVMVDVSLGGHKHQLTASAEQKEIWIYRGHYWTLSKGNTRTEISSGDTSHLFVPSTILSIHLEKMASNVSVTWAFYSRKIWKPWGIIFSLMFAYGKLHREIKIKTNSSNTPQFVHVWNPQMGPTWKKKGK